MNPTDLGVIIALVTLLLAIVARTELRERRLQRLETDMHYLRRDMDQIIGQFKLVPAAEQDRRKRTR